jgi:hypothetical protein
VPRPCWAQFPVPRKGSPIWYWHRVIHLNHIFSLSDLRRWCKCRKDPVDERQWRILAILKSLKMVTNGNRRHTPPWPRRKPTGSPRPALYTQIMLDIAITSKGSNGEPRPRAQVTAVIGRPFCPMTVESCLGTGRCSGDSRYQYEFVSFVCCLVEAVPGTAPQWCQRPSIQRKSL